MTKRRGPRSPLAAKQDRLAKPQTISVNLGFNLTEKQLQAVLCEYIGWPDTEPTRKAIAMRLHQHVVIEVKNSLELKDAEALAIPQDQRSSTH